MVGSWERLCPGFEMVEALGPYDDVVRIRDADVYERWHSKRGLRCNVCRNEVEIYTQGTSKKRFLRHGKNTPPGRVPGGGRGSETTEHAALKYWTRDHLRSIGFADAEVEPQLGEQFPDVYSTLDYATAAARTAGLRAAGCDQVLWIARHCDWIERLPAAGLASFTPGRDGNYYLHTGYLAMRAPWSGRRALAVQECSLNRFLTRWADQELVWAYTTTTTAGWATVTDWEHHTRDQAAPITDLQQRLRRSTGQLEQARRRRDELTDQLTNTAEELRGIRDELDTERIRHTQTRDNLNADIANLRTQQAEREETQRRQLATQATTAHDEKTALSAALDSARHRATTWARATVIFGLTALVLALLLLT